MIDCYTKLSTTTTINTELLNLCNDGSAWIDPSIGTFCQKHPSMELIRSDPFLNWVCENYILYDFRTSVHIFMLRPWSHYQLHTDKFRSASINMLINPGADSISYFQTSEFYKLQCSITELQYEPLRYYLFNSRIPHAMTNRDSERYLLSISLKYDYATMKGLLADYSFLN